MCAGLSFDVATTCTHTYKIESRNLHLHLVYQIVIRSLE